MSETVDTLDKLLDFLVTQVYTGVKAPGPNDPQKIAAMSAAIESLANARRAMLPER